MHFIKLLSFLLLSTLFGCGGGGGSSSERVDDSPTKEQPSTPPLESLSAVIVGAEHGVYRERAYVVQINDVQLLETAYAASLGNSTPLELQRISDSDLLLLLPPNSSSGATELQIDIQDKVATVEFDVIVEPLRSRTTNEASLLSTFTEYENLVDALISDYREQGLNDSVIVELEQYRESLSLSSSQIDKLSDQELDYIVRFIDTNMSSGAFPSQSINNSYKTLAASAKSFSFNAYDVANCETMSKSFLTQTAKSVAWGGTLAAMTNFPPALGTVLGAVAAVQFVDSIQKTASSAQKLLDDCVFPAGLRFVNELSNFSVSTAYANSTLTTAQIDGRVEFFHGSPSQFQLYYGKEFFDNTTLLKIEAFVDQNGQYVPSSLNASLESFDNYEPEDRVNAENLKLSHISDWNIDGDLSVTGEYSFQLLFSVDNDFLVEDILEFEFDISDPGTGLRSKVYAYIRLDGHCPSFTQVEDKKIITVPLLEKCIVIMIEPYSDREGILYIEYQSKSTLKEAFYKLGNDSLITEEGLEPYSADLPSIPRIDKNDYFRDYYKVFSWNENIYSVLAKSEWENAEEWSERIYSEPLRDHDRWTSFLLTWFTGFTEANGVEGRTEAYYHSPNNFDPIPDRSIVNYWKEFRDEVLIYEFFNHTPLLGNDGEWYAPVKKKKNVYDNSYTRIDSYTQPIAIDDGFISLMQNSKIFSPSGSLDQEWVWQHFSNIELDGTQVFRHKYWAYNPDGTLKTHYIYGEPEYIAESETWITRMINCVTCPVE